MPSPLDSPRLFDDHPLSAWFHGSTSFVAAKNQVQGKAFANAVPPSRYRLQPEHECDPIGVEIVRGAGGPNDDDWTVLVDGIRCRRIPPILEDGNEPFRVQLPPGVALPQEGLSSTRGPLTRNTKVRQVVVGVRLEEEAVSYTHLTLPTILLV